MKIRKGLLRLEDLGPNEEKEIWMVTVPSHVRYFENEFKSIFFKKLNILGVKKFLIH
jgi:hypothetical protein